MKPSLLTPSSLLPLGAAATIMVAGITSAIWLNSTLLSLGYKLDALVGRIDRLEITANDRWSHSDMRAWAALLHASNPTLVVPEVNR